MYVYMGMTFESKEKTPDFGSIKMYFVGTKELGYVVQGDKKFRKYALLSSDLSKLNLITNAMNGSVAFLVDTGETYKLSNSGWQKWSNAANSASLSLKTVDELPQTGQTGYIYLVPNEHDENDNYDEYIWTSDQTFEKIGNTAITYPVMTGATYNSNGVEGLVPAPTSSQRTYFLKGDGTWGNTTSLTDIPSDANLNDQQFYHPTNASLQYYSCYYGNSPSILNKPSGVYSGFVLQTKYFSGYRAFISIQTIYTSNAIYQRQISAGADQIKHYKEWKQIYPLQTATQNSDGLMSLVDKTKLDNITPSNLLTKSDIIICTQQEYDAMNNRQGLLYFIKEVSS